MTSVPVDATAPAVEASARAVEQVPRVQRSAGTTPLHEDGAGHAEPAAPQRAPRVRRAPPATPARPQPQPGSPPRGEAAGAGAARPRPAPQAARRPARAARAPRAAPTAPVLWGVGLSGVGALFALAGVLVMRPIEKIVDPGDPMRIVVYALLVLAPAAIFWAAGLALRMGRFWLFGTLAWATFGYVLIFLAPPPPGEPVTVAAVAGFLALLFAALTASLALPLQALGWVLFTQRVRRQDLRRAVRQAGLLALFAIACLGMVLFAVFNGLNALLLFAVLALAEFFFLSRG